MVLIVSLASFGLACWLYYKAWQKWQQRRTVRNTPRSTTRSVSMGRTELHGKINDKQPFKAPITGKPALACEWTVKVPANQQGTWKTLQDGTEATTCYLKDSTGHIKADLTHVTIQDGHTYTKKNRPDVQRHIKHASAKT